MQDKGVEPSCMYKMFEQSVYNKLNYVPVKAVLIASIRMLVSSCSLISVQSLGDQHSTVC